VIKDNFLNYIEILRPGHWFKNLVVLFGAMAGISFFGERGLILTQLGKILLAFFLACLVSSVNYAVNNITDEKNDSYHPIKKSRALQGKKIPHSSLLFLICLLLLAALSIAKFFYGNGVTIFLLSLFVAGLFYNVKPLRFKDLPFLDVITESVNNPIRILIGWFSISRSLIFPPVVFLLLFWALGAMMMSAKRYAELNFLYSYKGLAPSLYRNSYRFYSLKIIYLMFNFFSAIALSLFIFLSLRYRVKLLFSVPLILGYFFWLAKITKEKNSSFREPENFVFKMPVFSLVTLGIVLIELFLFMF